MAREELATKPIAVISAGASGITHAADAAMEGREVRLFEFPEFFTEKRAIRHTNTVTLQGPQMNCYGLKHEGDATISLISDNMADVVKGAGIIILSLPAVGFERACEELVPLLEDGQVIHFMAGNFGTLVLAKKMREHGCTKKILMGEWSSQPFGTRIVSDENGVELPLMEMFYRAITLRGCALPSTDTDEWMDTIKYIPSMFSVKHPEKGDSVVDVSFSNINPLLHPAASVLSVSMMENWTTVLKQKPFYFSIYSHGFCKSVSEVQYRIYLEQKATVEALGTTMWQLTKEGNFSDRSSILAPEYEGKDYKVVPYETEWTEQAGAGPHTISHRYITEDTPVGLSAQRAFARAVGVPTPTMDAVIHLASVMNGTDFNTTGWSLETLGFAGWSKEAIIEYLHTGKL